MLDSRFRGNDSLWFWLVLALAAFLFAVPATAQTFPALSGRVVDQANIIPDDREAAMVQRLEQLQRATSRQLVVATVSSLEGNDISDYAYQLGRHWGIGQAGANNGAVLLVAPNERRVWITVGPGLQGFVTDAFTGQVIRDQIIPRFRENDYPGGIEAGVSALITQLAAPPEQAEQRAIEAERARDSADAGGGEGRGGAGFGLIVLLVIIGLPILIGMIGAAGNKRRPARPSPWGRAYRDERGDDGSGLGWLAASIALNVLTSGRGGGGSSWGGGGSSSWGGGFSGGGGSFDGGGAGGSW